LFTDEPEAIATIGLHGRWHRSAVGTFFNTALVADTNRLFIKLKIIL